MSNYFFVVATTIFFLLGRRSLTIKVDDGTKDLYETLNLKTERNYGNRHGHPMSPQAPCVMTKIG